MTTQWNIKPGELVEVIWLDPAAASHWEDPSEITGCLQIRCRSVGWVHAVDDYGCVLTACYEPNDREQLLLRQHLPWGCIEEVWILE